MENYSDSDTSSESEYDSGGGSTAVSDCDEDEPSQDQESESRGSPNPQSHRTAPYILPAPTPHLRHTTKAAAKNMGNIGYPSL
jgi:hypothetical protein